MNNLHKKILQILMEALELLCILSIFLRFLEPSNNLTIVLQNSDVIDMQKFNTPA